MQRSAKNWILAFVGVDDCCDWKHGGSGKGQSKRKCCCWRCCCCCDWEHARDKASGSDGRTRGHQATTAFPNIYLFSLNQIRPKSIKLVLLQPLENFHPAPLFLKKESIFWRKTTPRRSPGFPLGLALRGVWARQAQVLRPTPPAILGPPWGAVHREAHIRVRTPNLNL